MNDRAGSKPTLILAISSYRNDDAVEHLIETVAPYWPDLIDRVVVVDSQPTGRLHRSIAEREWKFVEYHTFETNLGSAGNLVERLKIAAAAGARYALMLNHDGVFDPKVVESLVAEAEAIERVGAVYPLRRITAHGGRFDLTGRHHVPRPFTGVREPPRSAVTEVYWSSSNAALYALDPVRAGLLPWADLWMGWEDLGFGWLLHREGYRQVVANEAVLDDSYEYRPHRIGPLAVRASDKPLWYTYYRIRNLILVTRRIRPGLAVSAGVAARVALDLVLAVALRDQRRHRFALYRRGLIDGLRGVSGKWILP